MIVVVLGLAGIAVAVAGGDDSSASPPPRRRAETWRRPRQVSVSGDVVPTLDTALVEDPAIGMAFPTIEGQTFDGTPI